MGANHRLAPGKISILAPVAAPGNHLTKLRSALVHIVDPIIPIQISLPWNYGFFLAEIPARLGINEALDKTSSALIASINHYHTKTPEPPLGLLRKHGYAVAALRRCLEDPKLARATETLCAVQLVMIYQVILAFELSMQSHSHILYRLSWEEHHL